MSSGKIGEGTGGIHSSGLNQLITGTAHTGRACRHVASEVDLHIHVARLSGRKAWGVGAAWGRIDGSAALS